MKLSSDVILNIQPLGFPWATSDPFLFCVYHADQYPKGDGAYGPAVSLEGRDLGNDFKIRDGWRMYHGKSVPGFPVHPHRGFETVTVVRNGMVDHSDSLGGAGRYGHGDAQWMTAGRGIQHSEMFPLLNTERPNPLELFQIWINLPGKNKFVEPYYAMLWKEQIPVIPVRDDNGLESRLEIIAGQYNGKNAPDPAPDSWAASADNEVAIWYMQMEAHATLNLPTASKSVRRTLYFFEGNRVKINGSYVNHGNYIELDAHQPIQLENGTREGRFLLLQGRPILEPVVNYGPFVMNTEEEIRQTFSDYRKTHFGGWPWPRPDMVHPVDKGRFALHAGGREELPDL
jgi:redox-sensitive bicupin YhaK (pirin superfamily)